MEILKKAKRVDIIEKKLKKDLGKLEKEKKRELLEFDDEVNKEREELIGKIKEEEAKINERQQEEKNNFEEEFEENFAKLNIGSSPEILDLERKKESIVKQKNFKEAQIIQNQIEEIKKKLEEKWNKETKEKKKN